MEILVCGGAGYIGSHMVAYLLENNYKVIVLDNLSTGHEEALLGGNFYKGDLRDTKILDKVFSENNIEAVIDFAAFSIVSESMTDPLKYFNNNVSGTITLLEAMNRHNVKYLVFSSTAATYGEPDIVPICEDNKTNPTNAYGESKLMMEKILKWCDYAYGIKYTALRYFNACGSHINGKIGENHNPETHLIPLVLDVVLGKRENIKIYGDDYPTKDGSCIRDYIHVTDLASAHLLALKRLMNGGNSEIYNLGNGTGFSVKEVIDIARKVTNHPIPAEISPKRAGDPAILIASSEKAINELGWTPKYNDLETIISTAYNYKIKNK